jgi:nucleotide-binding universal stress UspA family protein
MEYKKILVAFDAHDATSSILFEDSLDLARKTGGELMLFCCFEQTTVAEEEDRVATFSEMDMSGSQVIHDKQRVGDLAHMSAWLGSLAEVAAEHGVRAEAHAENGSPGQRICEMAVQWGAEMIVLGHSSRHPLKRLLLGNINNHVIREAHCAVLVIKRK